MARPGAQQAGYGGPTSTTASDSVTSHAPMKRPPEGEYQVSLINGQPMTEAEIDAKKQRRGSASSSDDESSPRKSKLLKGNLATPSSSTDGPTIAAEVDGPLGIDWKVDPWELDAESSNYHTDLYFDNINSATYCMFPRDPFMRWCQECRTKDEKDKMLVYSLLAMGSIFSTRPGRHSTVRKLLGVAEYAVTSSFGKFSLQLVQARLILALVHFSLGNSMKAWDYCGAGIRSACGMKLNVEEGIQNMTTEENLDYWFNASTLRECHRRTFWSAFIMDRFNGFCSGHISILHIDDCLIRLPALESCYDSQVECSPTPFFRNNLIDPTLCAPAQSPSTIGSMGHLVTISSLWGEVLAFLYRSAYISSSLYSQHYDVHYSALMNRLSEWHSSLPPHLVWSPSNLDSTLRTGYIGTYVTMHTMYHASVIKLNRHTNFSHLSLEEIQRNTRIAHHHARALLTATRLMTQIDQTAHLHYSDTQFAFSTPSIGYSILAAVDVLSYAGSLDDLAEVIQLIDSGLEITEELVGFWSSAKSQFRLIGSRLQALTEIHADLGSNGPPLESEMHRDNANVTTITRHSSAKAWALSDPLDNIFTAVEDVIYHFDKVKYLKFIGVDVQAPEDVV
ncbi:putative c6 transcription factor [Phaeomoniella chlamydospora]|uniref:Putative c6 transcription factor n=1 Tax=Phaeomoniella chlamydospora TaxID=158046 RepID=A0A0G2H4M1_PHACM|nr:putative c6 transcription factor [Phaeomoniella chlamydospora]